jgi:dihydropyrimidinase
MAVLIRGGTVVNADRQFRADVLCDGGTIKAVGESLDAPTGAEVLDAGGAYVIPGGIDPHTHMQMPFMGTVACDDFLSGTAAGLAGGTTLIIDFCLPAPQQSLVDALDQWEEWGQKACADYSFHLAVTWWSERVEQQMAACVDRGVNSFKHFMAYKGALMVDDETLFKSFSRCRELGALPMVHAENGDAVFLLQQQLLAQGITGPEGHCLSRPPHVEGEAANRAIMIAQTVGVPLYVVHVSCKEAHDAVRRARDQGLRVYGEPLAQYLVVDESVYYNQDWAYAAARVMSPPFRTKDHQRTLLDGLAAGSLQVVASDHCAFTVDQKRMGQDNFTRIPNGTACLEERMKLLWTEAVTTGRLTPSEFVAVTSTNAAQIFNIYPQKGVIREGSDADIVLWDPTAEQTLSKSTQHGKLDVNILEGYRAKGLPAVTLSQGKVVWKEGDLRITPGSGRKIHRNPRPETFKAQEKINEITRPRGVKRQVHVHQTP